MAHGRFGWFVHQRAVIPCKGQRHRRTGPTGNPLGTCFPVQLAVTNGGSEFLTTQFLRGGVFRSAVLAEIDSKEHRDFLTGDTTKKPGADSLETMIRNNTRRCSWRRVGPGSASVRGSVCGNDSMGA